MKIFAILRGFPGLGRVMPGLTLVETLKNKYNADIKIFTYMQGKTALKLFQFQNFTDQDVNEGEITSLGLDPVGQSSARIVDNIIKWNPDIVLIDGEPLLINLISLCYDKRKVISLLNPADLNNDYLPYSTKKFFEYSFLNCACGIVHGINIDRKNSIFNSKNVYCTNTIIRNKIIDLKKKRIVDDGRKKITCILGGGSKSQNKDFIDSTITLGKNIINAAKILKKYDFNIYSNDDTIINNLKKELTPKNVKIMKEIGDEIDLYLNTSLVICRAGRNTISEIIFLNIPCILISSGKDYRTSEQKKNIQNVIEQFNEASFEYNNKSIDELVSLIEKSLSKDKFYNKFNPGNQDAIKRILEVYKKNKSHNRNINELLKGEKK